MPRKDAQKKKQEAALANVLAWRNRPVPNGRKPKAPIRHRKEKRTTKPKVKLVSDATLPEDELRRKLREELRHGKPLPASGRRCMLKETARKMNKDC